MKKCIVYKRIETRITTNFCSVFLFMDVIDWNLFVFFGIINLEGGFHRDGLVHGFFHLIHLTVGLVELDRNLDFILVTGSRKLDPKSRNFLVLVDRACKEKVLVISSIKDLCTFSVKIAQSGRRTRNAKILSKVFKGTMRTP